MKKVELQFFLKAKGENPDDKNSDKNSQPDETLVTNEDTQAEIVDMKDIEYESEHPMIMPGKKEKEEEPTPNPEEFFKVKNLDTGEQFDMRDKETEDKLLQNPNLHLTGTAWKDVNPKKV